MKSKNYMDPLRKNGKGLAEVPSEKKQENNGKIHFATQIK